METHVIQSITATDTEYSFPTFYIHRGGTLPQPVLPVLREEAVPARAASDLAFMKSFF